MPLTPELVTSLRDLEELETGVNAALAQIGQAELSVWLLKLFDGRLVDDRRFRRVALQAAALYLARWMVEADIAE